jgi:hypothetical protein
MPNLPNSKSDPETLQLERKGDAPKIFDLVGRANILGMVVHEKDILLIYDG